MVFIFKLGLVCALAILSLVLTVSVGSENVKLEVYVESGCPISQAFILGELTTVLAMPDIKNITDYKYVPFGNSFVNETTKTYQCYDAVECETDAIQLCSMYKFSNDIGAINSGSNSYACFPFTSCMEANQGNFLALVFPPDRRFFIFL